MSEQTTLLMVDRDVTIDALIDQVRKSGTSHVDLLITQGAPALESRKACDRLREMANRQSIEVTFYTDNAAIIRAAEKCQINVVPVDPAALGMTAAPVNKPVDPDAAFLQSLADVPFENPPQAAALTPDVNARDWLGASEDPFNAVQPLPSKPAPEPAAEEQDDWFDAFNDFSDIVAGNTDSTPVEAPRQRIRPEDIELTSEDIDRQVPRSKRAKEGQEDAKGGSKLRNFLLVALVAVGLGFLAWWFLFRNAGLFSIEIAPPPVDQQVISDVRLTLTSEAIDENSDSIQGRIVASSVSVVTRGAISSTSSVPDAAASGVLTIINRNAQPYTLPAGTSVIATGPNGEDLLFRTTQEVVVPAATSSFSGTTNGVADVDVVATAGGEIYNVAAWTEERPVWGIRGYEGVLFGLNNDVIGGGSVREERIPTQEDVRALLGAAVPQLKNEAITQLQNQLQPGELLIVGVVPIQPDIDTLAENPGLYSVETRPIEGSNDQFELVITAEFRGVAVPGDKPVDQQLQRALPRALQLHSISMENTQILSQDLRLVDENNVNLLVANVAIGPRTDNTMIAETQQAEIINNLLGKSWQDAQAYLADLARRGEIGQYRLPPLADPSQTLPLDPTKINITEFQVQQ